MATGYAQTLEEWTETSATAATLITYTLGDDIIAQGKSHWTKTGDVWAINTTGGVEATQYLLYDGHGSTRNLAEYDATTGATITAAYAYDGYGVRLGNQAEPAMPKKGGQETEPFCFFQLDQNYFIVYWADNVSTSR